MADGSTRPIEEVDVGEKVLATDPETGEQTARTVLATIVGSGSKHLVEITVDPTTEREAAGEDAGSEAEGEQAEQAGIPGPVTAGDVIIATNEHPFWVPDLGAWVDAIDLAPGTWLQTSAGTWVQVSAVQAWTQAATVHNLTVQGVHTFHVAAGSLDALNHNCNGDAFITPERSAHIEGAHGPGARDMDPQAGEFSEDFLWDGEEFAMDSRLVNGANSTPELPNPNGRGHMHRVYYNEPNPVGWDGKTETNMVQIVANPGEGIVTAMPKKLW